MKKRILAMLLTVCMVLSMLPMSALAARVDDEPIAVVPVGEETHDHDHAHEAAKPADATDAQPAAEADNGQTYATPADAVNAGMSVTYLSFRVANSDTRYWASSSEPYAVDLYKVAGTLEEIGTAATIAKDTDGIDSGAAYALVTNLNNKDAVMHNRDGYTLQCDSSRTTVLHHGVNSDESHAFIFELADGSWSIRPALVENSYLSLEGNAANNRVFKSTKTPFYITPANDPNDGSYYIWTAQPMPPAGVHYLVKATGNGWTISDTPTAVTLRTTANANFTGDFEAGTYRLWVTNYCAAFVPTGNTSVVITGDFRDPGENGNHTFTKQPHGGYHIATKGYDNTSQEIRYLTNTTGSYQHRGTWSGVEYSTDEGNAETFYVMPAAMPNNGTYYIYYKDPELLTVSQLIKSGTLANAGFYDGNATEESKLYGDEGDVAVRYGVAFAAGDALTLDFGSVKRVDRVRIVLGHETNAPTDKWCSYRLECSEDNANWATVQTFAGKASGQDVWDLTLEEPIYTQYLRLYNLGRHSTDENKWSWFGRFAAWGENEPASVPTHTVTFNDGTTESSVFVKQGCAAALPDPEPTKDGYKFLGWYTGTGNNLELFDGSASVMEDVDVHAEWRRTPLCEANANGTWDIPYTEYNGVVCANEEKSGDNQHDAIVNAGGTGNGAQAILAIDGVESSFYHSNYGQGLDQQTKGTSEETRWIGIDLGAEKQVSGFRYLPRKHSGGNGYVNEYAIEVSNDGENWKRVSRGTWDVTYNSAASAKTWQTANFPTQTVRYVRLKGIAVSSDGTTSHMNAAEIRAIGAPKDVLTVPDGGFTHSEEWGVSSGNEADLYNEGADSAVYYWVRSYEWTGDDRDHSCVNDYLRMDFGRVKEVQQVRVVVGKDNDGDRWSQYALEYSVDGENWTPYKTYNGVTSGKDVWNERLDTPVLARYLRLRNLEDVHKWLYFSKFIAFGNNNPTLDTYTVTFNADGGEVTPATTQVVLGSAVGTLPTPTREGYLFQGWFNGETEFTANTVVTGPLTVTAKWVRDPNTAVAMIGETPYWSLQDAIDAAQEAQGQTTVKLMQNTQEKITVSSGDIVLDLNGKKIANADNFEFNSRNPDYTVFFGAITVTGGTLTIDDTSDNKDGQVLGDAFAVVVKDGLLTVNNGTFGRTSEESDWWEPMFVGGGSAVVNGGFFLGGTLEYYHCYPSATKGSMRVNGGRFDALPLYVAANQGAPIWAPDAEGYVIAYPTYAAFAVDNAASFTYDSEKNVLQMTGAYDKMAKEGGWNDPLSGFFINGDVTLDLNGQTWTMGNANLIVVNEGTTLTVRDSVGEGKIENATQSVIETLGTLNIEGGTLSTANAYNNVIAANGNCTINISGGKLKGKMNSIISKEVTADRETRTINISGGEFNTAGFFIRAWKENNAATVSVSGGTFNENVAEYCVDGKKAVQVQGEDGKWIVVDKTYVAQIGETKYETLTEALNAADGTTPVTLLADVTEDATLSQDVAVTLETDAHTVKATVFVENGTLTFNGKSDTTARGHEGTADNNFIVKNGANLIVTGGEIKSGCTAVYVENGKANIQGGEFSVVAEGEGVWWNTQFMLNLWDEAETASITVEGGVFHGYDPANSASENPEMDFVAPAFVATKDENGVYTVAAAKAQVTSLATDKVKGYDSVEAAIAAADLGDIVTVLEKPEGKIVVGDDKAVQIRFNGDITAEIDCQAKGVNTKDTKFEIFGGLEACVKAELALRGEESYEAPASSYGGYSDFELYKSVTLKDDVVLPRRDASTGCIIVDAKGDVTIDLAGHTISQHTAADLNNYLPGLDGRSAIVVRAGSHVTVTGNGTITGGANAVQLVDGASLTLENGTINTKGSSYNNQYGATVNLFGGEFIMNGGKLGAPVSGDSYGPLWAHGNCQITITDGQVVTGDSVLAIAFQGTEVNYVITGGTFGLDLTGKADAAGNSYLNNAEYWAVKGETDGTWTVQQKKVAEVTKADGTTQGYPSLQAAIDAANSVDDVVTLLVSTTESIVVTGDKMFDLVIPEGVTLTNEAGKHTITVNEGGSLTISGKGTVDNVSHGKAALLNYGDVTLGLYNETQEDGCITITRSKENGQNADNHGGNSYYTIDNHGYMSIDAATISQTGAYSSLIRNVGVESDDPFEMRGTLNINKEVRLIGGLNNIKNDDWGYLGIFGGTFEDASQYAVMNWNDADIYGGTFDMPVWNGIYTTKDGKVAGKGHMNISNANGIQFNGATSLKIKDGDVAISGGTFTGAVEVVDAEKTTLEISGGTFTTANVNEYCVEGKCQNPAENGGAVGDHSKGDLIAQVDPQFGVPGTKAHYACSVCGQLFDENGKEVTLEELAIDPLTSTDVVGGTVADALENNKFVGVIASAVDNSLMQIVATVDGGYNGKLTIPYAKVDTGKLTLGVGLKGVESLGMEPGAVRSHVVDTKLGNKTADLASYKDFLQFSDWKGFAANIAVVNPGQDNKNVTYTFAVDNAEDQVALKANTDQAAARAAWKAIFQNTEAAVGANNSKVVVKEGSYFQAGTTKVELQQAGDLVLDNVHNLNMAALKAMFKVTEATESSDVTLFLKKGTTLAVGTSSVTLTKDVTISSDNLIEADVAQMVQLAQALASGALAEEAQKTLTMVLLGKIVGLPHSVEGATTTTKVPMNIKIEFACEHQLVEVPEKPATVREPGVRAHYECSICGKLFDLETKEEVTLEDLEIPMLDGVAAIGNDVYPSLEAALDAAEDGDTVELLQNTQTSELLTVKPGVTLDGGKHTLTNNVGRVLSATGATVKDLTIEANGDGFAIYTDGNTRVEGCTFNGTTGGQPIYVNDDGAPGVVVDGCTFNTSRSMIIRSNATFTNNILNGAKGLTIDSSANGAVVTGNTFNNARLDIYPIDNAKVTIEKNQLLGTSYVELETRETYTEPVELDGNYWPNYEGSDKNSWDRGKTRDVVIAAWYEAPEMETLVAGPDAVAQVGDDMFFAYLPKAVAAADGQTVTLLKDASGAGVKLVAADKKTVTIDLNTHTYTVVKNPVGSTGFETQGFHFEKGNTVTVQNGTVKAADDVDAQVLIQNYCDLTLTNVKLVGGAATNYGLSCNAGKTTLNHVSISGKEGFTALDVMHWHGLYDNDAPAMTINNTADDTIDGKVAVYCYPESSAADCETPASLTVKGGKFTANVNEYCVNHDKAEGLCQNDEGVVVKHNVVTDKAVAPTYTDKGKTEGSHCSVCGEVFVKQEEIAMLALGTVAPYGNGKLQSHAQSNAVTVIFDDRSDPLTFSADGNDYGRTPNKWWAGIRMGNAEGDISKATYRKIEQWWLDDGNSTDWSEPKPIQTDGQYWGMATPAYMNGLKGEDNQLMYRYAFDWNGDDTIDQTVTILVKDTVKFSDAGKIAEVNGIAYPTLAEAIAAAESEDDTVTLLKSTTESVEISAEKEITLSIPADVTLTNEAGKHTITVAEGGSLIITGKGTVDNVSNGKAALLNYGDVTLGLYNETQEDGCITITRSKETGVDANTSGGNSYYTIDNHGYMMIDAATISQTGAYSSLIRNVGVESDDPYEMRGTLNINKEVRLIGGLNNIKNDDWGTLWIGGSTFEKAAQYSVMNWSTAEIDSNDATFDKPVWNGVYTEGGKTPGVGELNISGGNFNGKPAVKVKDGDVSITGGTFATDVNAFCLNNGEQGGYCWSTTDHKVAKHAVNTSEWVHAEDGVEDEVNHWHACSRCGHHFDEAKHDWKESKVVKAATCTEKGIQEFTCSVCGATKTEEIAALGHNLTHHKEVPATCTTEGTAEYWSCKRCEKLFSDAEGKTEITEVETIPVVEHTWGEWTTVTAATCKDKGLEKHICSVCGAEETRETEIDPNNHVGGTEVRDAVDATCTTEGYTGNTYCLGCGEKIADGETIPANGHAWDEGEVTTAATCTTDGVKTFHCANCTEIKTETIPATGHNTNGVVAHKAPTCTETGVQGGTYCTVCNHGKAEAEATIAALGHAWDNGAVTKEATCTEDGVKTFTCTREGCDETRTEAISKTGHTMTHHAAVAATCTTEGNKEYWSCANCNKNFADVAGVTELETVTIAELGHDFNTVWSHDGTNHWHVCSRCDATADVVEHVWGEGEITKPATCTEAGLRTFTCECGETKTETIEMIAHSYSTEWSHDGTSHWHACTVCGDKTDVTEHTWTVTEDPATCTEAGLRTSTCECGETKTEAIPALGHAFSTDWTHDSMYHWHVCTRDDCDATSGRAEHVWGEGVVTTAATCTTDGVRTFTCACGATKTEVIPATGHSFTNYVSDDNATCTKDGTKTATCDHEGCDVTDTVADLGSALGHAFSTDWTHDSMYHWHVCTRDDCDATSGRAEHVWTVTETPATCTTDGVRTFTCACGATKTEVIPATGHNAEGVVEHKDATCTEDGVVGGTYCTVCEDGKTAAETVIPALGHEYTKWASDENNHWHVCAHEGCEERKPDEEPAAHIWVNGPVSGGLRTDTCSECGATRTLVVISGGGGGTTIIYRPAPEEDLNEPDVPLAKPFLFTDVTEKDWFYEAVKDVFEKDLMEGINKEGTLFAPFQITTRGAVATLIHRMENTPAAEKPSNFGDVEDAMWYTEAIHWTDESGVMIGYDDGNFYPNQVVTREQLALVLYRYAKFRGDDVSAKGDLSIFTDAEDVSSWAMDGMTWAVGNGLIKGRSGANLAPQGTTTRGELATILQRFVALTADTQGE